VQLFGAVFSKATGHLVTSLACSNHSNMLFDCCFVLGYALVVAVIVLPPPTEPRRAESGSYQGNSSFATFTACANYSNMSLSCSGILLSCSGMLLSCSGMSALVVAAVVLLRRSREGCSCRAEPSNLFPKATRCLPPLRHAQIIPLCPLTVGSCSGMLLLSPLFSCSRSLREGCSYRAEPGKYQDNSTS
jgi:hypothetical protein